MQDGEVEFTEMKNTGEAYLSSILLFNAIASRQDV